MFESCKVNGNFRALFTINITKACLALTKTDSLPATAPGRTHRAPLAWSGSQVTSSGTAMRIPITMAMHTINGKTPM